MRPSLKWSAFLLGAVTLVAVVGTIPSSHGQTQDKAPRPASTRAEETLEMWNQIGNKLIAMAQDFPEDKYDFKVQKDQRTFAENILHVASFDYIVASKVSGSQVGPDFGKYGDNPPREAYKTKADVVNLMQHAIADGARVIQQQGDAGLDKTNKDWGDKLRHNAYLWNSAIEHSAEHYGQLVVYYRANNLVPPSSRK